MLPVDETAVEARRIFAQRLELGSLALLPLALDPVDRLAREELQGAAVYAAHAGDHVDGAVDRDLADELDEAERAAPVHPDTIDVALSGQARDPRQGDPQRLSDRQHADKDIRGLDLATLLRDQLECRRAPPAHRGDRDRGRAALADIEPFRH